MYRAPSNHPGTLNILRTTMFSVIAVLAAVASIDESLAFSSTPSSFVTTKRGTVVVPNRDSCFTRTSLVPVDVGSATVTTLSLSASPDEDDTQSPSSLPMLLDPGTKGGALFLSLVLFLLPFVGYNVATGVFGIDENEAGRWIGVGFTVVTSLAWALTYVFRVATKDMTYAKQLKDYENAVIAKRLEELDEDEIQALVEDIERDDF